MITSLAGLGQEAIDSIEYFLDDDKCSNAARKALILVNVNYVSGVADGEGVAAAAYEEDVSGIHPLVILEDEYDSTIFSDPSWNERIPDEWGALGEPEKVEMVLVFEDIEETELTRCTYGNSMTAEKSYRERIRQDWLVTLREAATSEVIAAAVLEGETPKCPEYVGSGDTPLVGRLQLDTLEDWLRPYVEG